MLNKLSYIIQRSLFIRRGRKEGNILKVSRIFDPCLIDNAIAQITLDKLDTHESILRGVMTSICGGKSQNVNHFFLGFSMSFLTIFLNDFLEIFDAQSLQCSLLRRSHLVRVQNRSVDNHTVNEFQRFQIAF
jgi:hypothetical protein